MSLPSKPADPSFDAIAAARELEESLGAPTDGGGQPAPARGSSYESMLETELVELNTALDQRERRIAELEQDIDRSRERIERESRKEAEERVRAVIRGFLDVIDDMDRALMAAREAPDGSAVLEGVELIRKRLVSRLADLGVRPLPAEGQAFDPNVHEAVTTERVSDPARNGRVARVLQHGWTIDGQLLRPARVVVGKAS